MTHVSTVIERYHRANEALAEKAEAIIVSMGSDGLTDDLLHAHVGMTLRREHGDLVREEREALIAYEQEIASLRVREVEAHERATAWATVLKDPSQ